jgi:hypothetical protein
MNFTRSSMGLHTFQGILRSPQKARLCNPCVRNELSPLSQEGHTTPEQRWAPCSPQVAPSGLCANSRFGRKLAARAAANRRSLVERL